MLNVLFIKYLVYLKNEKSVFSVTLATPSSHMMDSTVRDAKVSTITERRLTTVALSQKQIHSQGPLTVVEGTFHCHSLGLLRVPSWERLRMLLNIIWDRSPKQSCPGVV